MGIANNHLLLTVAVGIGATLFADAWALLLQRVFGVQPPHFCMVGRWLLHMPGGTFTHPSIAAAAPRRFECTVGWMAHYLIGIAFAFLLVAVFADGWLASPTLLPALLVGAATLVFPLLLMQPAFGLGFAASKTPGPWKVRLKSLMTHLVFGVGLYLSALVLGSLLEIR